MKNMFYECSSLTSLDLSSFDTKSVTTMQNMFSGCGALPTLDITHFNTANVTNMNGMFNNCKSLESIDLSKLNTDKVTDMSSMFTGCNMNVVFTNRTNDKLNKANSMFNVYYGSSIDLTNFSLLNSTNNDNFITLAPNLVHLAAPSNINKHIKITASNLSVDSLMSIIDNLLTVNITQTLEIGSANLAKLSDEQIAVAINKNWTLS
jgi:surface protein